MGKLKTGDRFPAENGDRRGVGNLEKIFVSEGHGRPNEWPCPFDGDVRNVCDWIQRIDYGQIKINQIKSFSAWPSDQLIDRYIPQINDIVKVYYKIIIDNN